MEPIIHPYQRPLNHPKYKKDTDLDAHVWVFKVVVKANKETINEKIVKFSSKS